MERFLYRVFNGPIWRNFLLMGLFAGLSGYMSYNLVMLFVANFSFVSEYGFMALKEGGLLQLIELIVYAYLGLAFYVLFKGCLDGLLARVSKR